LLLPEFCRKAFWATNKVASAKFVAPDLYCL
jgi:hypothetical protein